MENEADYFMMNYLIDESEGHFDYFSVLKKFQIGYWMGMQVKIKILKLREQLKAWCTSLLRINYNIFIGG